MGRRFNRQISADSYLEQKKSVSLWREIRFWFSFVWPIDDKWTETSERCCDFVCKTRRFFFIIELTKMFVRQNSFSSRFELLGLYLHRYPVVVHRRTLYARSVRSYPTFVNVVKIVMVNSSTIIRLIPQQCGHHFDWRMVFLNWRQTWDLILSQFEVNF